ncbi:hypothetical protein [Carboxylicivirga sp. RSCT41]|uniref:hypothetical protein n=1 Tax=Carboxylicivirga agarovorans TaxID=3417570 RepID=UPI003D353D81
MSVKSTIYTTQRRVCNLLLMLVLLAACNASLFANVTSDNKLTLQESFKKAVYCSNGSGKTAFEEIQAIDGRNMSLDLIIKPRSIKKQCVIAEQTDGINGYRLLQDGRNIVFEMNVSGFTHRSVATNVLDKGQQIFVSAYCNDGYLGIKVNGKKPINSVYRIGDNKFAKLFNANSDSDELMQLSSLTNKEFNNLSVFRKTLRKTLGRKNYKKYKDEIVSLALEETELDHIYIADNFSISNSTLHVGKAKAVSVEQIRVWQPARLLSGGNKIELVTEETKVIELKMLVAKCHKPVDISRVNRSVVVKNTDPAELTITASLNESAEPSDYYAGNNFKTAASESNFLKCLSTNQFSNILADGLITSEQAATVSLNTQSIFGSYADKVSVYEHVLRNGSLENYFLRTEEETKSYIHPGFKKAKYFKGVKYVKQNLVEYSELASLSNSVFVKEEQQSLSSNNREMENENFIPKKSFLNYLSELKSIENQNKFYASQNSGLVSKKDRITNLNNAVVGQNFYIKQSGLVGEKCIFKSEALLSCFHVSGNCSDGVKICDTNRFKYVNYNIGCDDTFYSGNLSEYAHICSFNNGVVYSNKRYSTLLLGVSSDLNDSKHTYHNRVAFSQQDSDISGSANEIFDNNRRSYRGSVKLNRIPAPDRDFIKLSDRSLAQLNKQDRKDWILFGEISQKSSSSFAGILQNAYEGPPDIPDRSRGIYCQSYLKNVKVRHGKG